ncbi:MAG: nucleotidyltransferase family protein [Cyanobacteriota bacterium]|nr:nucleotidyltransferase family protein [Cyanobacteriota bacterium]
MTGRGDRGGQEWQQASALMAWLLNPAETAPVPPQQWRCLLERCQALRIGPQAMHRLAVEPGAVPAADQHEFNRLRMQGFVATTQVLRVGCRALERLRAAGIQAVGFKGLATVGWLHGGRPERGMGDCDLLISSADCQRALIVLLEAGFLPTVQDVAVDDLIEFVASSPGSAGNRAISLAGPDGSEIDLHWHLGGLDVAVLMGDARPRAVLGLEVPLVRPAVGCLLAVQHALRNDFVPDEVIRDLLDAAGWLALLEGDPAEQAWLLQMVRRAGLEDALVAVALILQAVNSRVWCLPPSPRAQALVDHWTRQLEHQAINRDLLYLCSLRPGRRLLAGVARSGAEYWRVMGAMETAIGDQRRSVRRRLLMLARAAWRTSWSDWQRLRALASLKARLDC